jgi:hypothetical protein
MSDHKDKGRERFELELVAQPDEVPAIVRLKRLLKVALRAFGLRCVGARTLGGTPQAAQDVAGEAEATDGPKAGEEGVDAR